MIRRMFYVFQLHNNISSLYIVEACTHNCTRANREMFALRICYCLSHISEVIHMVFTYIASIYVVIGL